MSMNIPQPRRGVPVNATYEMREPAPDTPQTPPEGADAAREQQTPPTPPPNITALPRTSGGPGRWMLYLAAILGVTAVFALLLSLNTDEPEPRRRGGRDDGYAPRWRDLVDDGRIRQGDRSRRRADEGYDDDGSDDDDRRGERRRERPGAPQAASAGMNFIPPIIINTPGQPAQVFGGGSGSSKQGGES